jgi:hypothetical protein
MEVPMSLRDPAAAIVVFAAGLFFFILSGSYPATAALFPRIVAAVMMVSAALLFAKSIWRPSAAGTTLSSGEGEVERMSPEGARRVAIAIGLTLIYVVAIVPIGFLTASVLYIPATAYILGLRSHMLVWITTIIFVAAIYYLFEAVFHTPLPPDLIRQIF